MEDVTVRQAREEDHDAVAAFTSDTWPDREVEDWIPSAFPELIAGDGDGQRTFVADIGGNIGGIVQGTLLSEYEGWAQGMRINPEYRGRDLSLLLTETALSWCKQQGASVARNLVFSWNDAGLGTSRAAGFEPAVEARLAEPEPEAGTDLNAGVGIESDPDAAWAFWTRSDARDRLGGLGLDPEESWALSTVTRDRLTEAERVITVHDEEGTRASTARLRQGERETDEGIEAFAVYGHSAWRDLDSARALFDAITADAADIGADATRVLVPESCRHVSDLAAVRADPADQPLFVLAADLTSERY